MSLEQQAFKFEHSLRPFFTKNRHIRSKNSNVKIIEVEITKK